MTTLSERLQAAAEQLPAALPPAAQVRRSAEQRRRTTAVMTTAAALVVALTAAVSLALGVGGTDHDRITPAPAGEAGPENVISGDGAASGGGHVHAPGRPVPH